MMERSLPLFLFISVYFLSCGAFKVPTLRFRGALSTSLHAKKGKKSAAYKNNAAPSKKETQGNADRFDAITREFMFTISKLTKKLPDSDRTILKNINLCFFPGTHDIVESL